MYCNRRTTAELAPRSVVGVMDTSPTPAAPDAASGLGRRSLLKKAAVGGAVAWATPVVLSSPAFADCGSAVGGVTATNFLVHAFWTTNGTSRVQLRPYLDPACSSGAGSCASPQPFATYQFSIASQTAFGPPFGDDPAVWQGDTQTTLAASTSGVVQPFTAGLFTAAPPVSVDETTPGTVANIALAGGLPTTGSGETVIAMKVQFRCADGSDERCSLRFFKVTLFFADAVQTVEYPPFGGAITNSPAGFAVSCCADPITPAWC